MSSTSSFRTFFRGGGGGSKTSDAVEVGECTTPPSTSGVSAAACHHQSPSPHLHDTSALTTPTLSQSPSSGDRAVLLMHLQNIQLALSSLPPRPPTAAATPSLRQQSPGDYAGEPVISLPQIRLLRGLAKSTTTTTSSSSGIDAALDVTLTNTMNKLTSAFGAASGAWGGVWDRTGVLAWEPSVLLLLASGVLPATSSSTTPSSLSASSTPINVSGVSSVLNALLQPDYDAPIRMSIIHTILSVLVESNDNGCKDDDSSFTKTATGIVNDVAALAEEDPVTVVSRAVRALRSNLLGSGGGGSSSAAGAPSVSSLSSPAQPPLSPVQLLHPFLLAVALLGGPSHRLVSQSTTIASSSSPQPNLQHRQQQQQQNGQQRHQQYNAGVEAVLGVAVAAIQALMDSSSSLSPPSTLRMFTPQTLCLTSEVVLTMIRTLVLLPTPTASKPHLRQETGGGDGGTTAASLPPSSTASQPPPTKSSLSSAASSTQLNESLLHRLLHLSLALVRHPATPFVPEAMVVNLVHASLLVATNGSAQIRQGVVVMVPPQKKGAKSKQKTNTTGNITTSSAVVSPPSPPASSSYSNSTMMIYTAAPMSVSDLLRGSAELMCLDMVSAALYPYPSPPTPNSSCHHQHGPSLLSYAAALIRFPTFDFGSPDDYRHAITPSHGAAAGGAPSFSPRIHTATMYYAAVDRTGSGVFNNNVASVTPVVQLHGIGLTQSILHKSQQQQSHEQSAPSATMLRLQQVVRSGLSRALLCTTNPTSSSALNCSVAVALLGDDATLASLQPSSSTTISTSTRRERSAASNSSESSASSLIHLPASSSLTSRLGGGAGDEEQEGDALKVMCLTTRGARSIGGAVFRHPSKLFINDTQAPYRVYLVVDDASLHQELDAIATQKEEAARQRQALEELTAVTAKNGTKSSSPSPQQQAGGDGSSSNAGASSVSSSHNIVILSQLLRTLHLVLDFNVSENTMYQGAINDSPDEGGDDDADSASSSSDLGGYDNNNQNNNNNNRSDKKKAVVDKNKNGSVRRNKSSQRRRNNNNNKGPSDESSATTVLKTLQILEGAILEPIQELLAPAILPPLSSLGHSTSYLMSYLLAFEQVQHNRSITLNSIPSDGDEAAGDGTAGTTCNFSSTLTRAVSDLVDHITLLLPPPPQPQSPENGGTDVLSDQSTAGSPTTVSSLPGGVAKITTPPKTSLSSTFGSLILPSGGNDSDGHGSLASLSAHFARSDAIDDTICHQLITAAPAMSLLYCGGGHGHGAPVATHALSSYDGPVSNGLSKEEYAMLPYLVEGSSNSINNVQPLTSMSMLDRCEAIMRSYLKLSRMRRIVLSGLLHHHHVDDQDAPGTAVATTTVVGTLPDPRFDHAADLAAGYLISQCAHTASTNLSTTTPVASPTTPSAAVPKFTTTTAITDGPNSSSGSPSSVVAAPTDLDHLHTSVLVESLAEFCSAPLFAPYCLLNYDLSPIHTTVFRGASAHTTTDSGGVCGQKGVMQEEGGGGTTDACESNILHLAPVLATEPTPPQAHDIPSSSEAPKDDAVAVKAAAAPPPTASSSSLVAALPKMSSVPLRPGQRPLSLSQVASQAILNDSGATSTSSGGGRTVPYYAVCRLGLDAAQHELQASAALSQRLHRSLASSSCGQDGGEVDVSVAALDRFLGACQTSLLQGGRWDPVTSTFLGSASQSSKNKKASTPASSNIDIGTFHAPLLESILTFLLRAVVQASVGSSTRALSTAMSTSCSSPNAATTTTVLQQLLLDAAVTTPSTMDGNTIDRRDDTSSSSHLQSSINDRLLLTPASYSSTTTDPVVLRLAQRLQAVDKATSGGEDGMSFLSDKIREAHAILWGVTAADAVDGVASPTSPSPLTHLHELAANHAHTTAIQRRLELAEVLHGSRGDGDAITNNNRPMRDGGEGIHNLHLSYDKVVSGVVKPIMELARISNGPGGLALQALSSLVENLQQRQQQESTSSQSQPSTELFDRAVKLAQYRSLRIRAFATLFNAREWKKALSLLMEADDPSILPKKKNDKKKDTWASKKNCLGITRPASCTATSVAKFLYNNRHALDRQVIGDFIGELGKECHEISDKDLRPVFEPFLQSEMMMASMTDAADNSSPTSPLQPIATPTTTTSTGFTVELVRARWDEEFAQRYPMSIPFMDSLLKGFLSCFKFTLKPLLRSIREVVHEVGLPGESQKIDRVMEAFALQWHRDNAVPPPLPSSPPSHPGTSPARRSTSPAPTGDRETTASTTTTEAAVRRYNEHRAALLAVNPFKGTDAAFILSFSLIMLNTDLHSGKLAKTMTVQDFRSMNRGIDDGGASLPEAFLTALYHDIKGAQIVMLDHAAKHMANVQREVTEELKEAAIHAVDAIVLPAANNKKFSSPPLSSDPTNNSITTASDHIARSTSTTTAASYPIAWNRSKASLGESFGILPVIVSDGAGGSVVTHVAPDGAFLACAATSEYAPEVITESSNTSGTAASPPSSAVGRGRNGNGGASSNNNTNAAAGVPLTPQARLEQIRLARIKKIADSTRVLYNTIIPTATSNAHLVAASTNPGAGCYNVDGSDDDDDDDDSGDYDLLDALQASSPFASDPSNGNSGIARCVDPYLLQAIWQPATAAFLAALDTTLSTLSGLDLDIGAAANNHCHQEGSRRYLVRNHMLKNNNNNNNNGPQHQAQHSPSLSTSLMSKYMDTSAIYSTVMSLCGPSASCDLTAAINGLLGLVDTSVRMCTSRREDCHSSGRGNKDDTITTRVISSILLTFVSEKILPALRRRGSSSSATSFKHDEDNDLVFEDPEWLIYYDLTMFLVTEIQHIIATTSPSPPQQQQLLTPPVLDAVADMSGLLFQRGYNICVRMGTTCTADHNRPSSNDGNRFRGEGVTTTPLDKILCSHTNAADTNNYAASVRRQRFNLPPPPSPSVSSSRRRGCRRARDAITNNSNSSAAEVSTGSRGWLSGLWGREAQQSLPTTSSSSTVVLSSTTPTPLLTNTSTIRKGRRPDSNNCHSSQQFAAMTRRLHIDLLLLPINSNNAAGNDNSVGVVTRMMDPKFMLPYLIRRASVPTTSSSSSSSPSEVADGISLLRFIASIILETGGEPSADNNMLKDEITGLAARYVGLTRTMVEKSCMGLFHRQHDASTTASEYTLVVLGEVVSEWSRLVKDAMIVARDLSSSFSPSNTIGNSSTTSGLGPTPLSSSSSSSSPLLYSEVMRSPFLLASLLIMPEGGGQQPQQPLSSSLLGGVQQMVWPALVESLLTLRAHTHICLRSSTLDHNPATNKKNTNTTTTAAVPQPVVESVLSLIAAIHHAGAEIDATSSSPARLPESYSAAVRELAFVSLVAVTELVLLPQHHPHQSGGGSSISAPTLSCTCGGDVESASSDDADCKQTTHTGKTPDDGLNSDVVSTTPIATSTTAPSVPCARCALVRAVVELLSDTLPSAGGIDVVMLCAEALSVLACASTYLHQTTIAYPASLSLAPSSNNAISEMFIVGLQRCLLSAPTDSSTTMAFRGIMFDGMLFPILDLLSNGPLPSSLASTTLEDGMSHASTHPHHHHRHGEAEAGGSGGGATPSSLSDGAVSLIRRYECTRRILQLRGVPPTTSSARGGGRGKSAGSGSSSGATKYPKSSTPTAVAAAAVTSGGGRLTGFFSPTTLLSSVFGPMAGPPQTSASSTSSTPTHPPSSTNNIRQTNGEEEGDEAFNIFSRALSMTFRVFAHWAPSAFNHSNATSISSPTTRRGPADAGRVWKRLLGMCYALASPLPKSSSSTAADPALLYASFPTGAVADLVEANVRNALRELLRRLPKATTAAVSVDGSGGELRELWKTTSQALTMFTWYAGSDEEALLADRL